MSLSLYIIIVAINVFNDPAGWKETISNSTEVEPSFPVQLDSCMPYQPCLSFKHLVVIQTPAQTTINKDKTE